MKRRLRRFAGVCGTRDTAGAIAASLLVRPARVRRTTVVLLFLLPLHHDDDHDVEHAVVVHDDDDRDLDGHDDDADDVDHHDDHIDWDRGDDPGQRRPADPHRDPSGAGTHGYPYDAVPADADRRGRPVHQPQRSVGYAEREFPMSGNATDVPQSGSWGSNGDWGVRCESTSPTRPALVRYPTDPAKFNGTVVFEWLNDTTGGDQDPVWAELYNELIDEGYAYVGVTAQTAGMADLKAWDPVRYGSLGDSSDDQSYDIFTQAAKVIRADYGTLLGGDVPKTLIGAGDSQSAFRLDTYVNAIQPVQHAFNGFLAVGRAVVAAPLGNGLVVRCLRSRR